MPVTNYYSVGGKILGHKVQGQPASSRVDYQADALGSVTATTNQAGVVRNTYRYKPYGSLLAKTGAVPDPAFTWVGSHGYKQTGKKYSDVYIRARHYSTTSGRWTSMDPTWPLERAYMYVEANVVTMIDPSGLVTWKIDPLCTSYETALPCLDPALFPSCAAKCGTDYNTPCLAMYASNMTPIIGCFACCYHCGFPCDDTRLNGTVYDDPISGGQLQKLIEEAAKNAKRDGYSLGKLKKDPIKKDSQSGCPLGTENSHHLIGDRGVHYQWACEGGGRRPKPVISATCCKCFSSINPYAPKIRCLVGRCHSGSR